MIKAPIKTLVYLLLFIVGPLCGSAQSPEEEVDPDNINTQYLEHLIKFKIDSIRERKGMHVFVNDSVLYMAASYHSRQMAKTHVLSHFENGAKYKTPQKRAETFGAVNYFVGENVAVCTPYKKFYIKTPDLNVYYSYGELAAKIVKGWTKSRAQLKNITKKECQITGVSIAYDKATRRIYVTQKIAEVKSKFVFEENLSLFPFEDPNTVEYDLTELKQVAHTMHKGRHRWGLKPRKKYRRCRQCDALAGVGAGFYVDSLNNIHGVITNGAFFKQFTKRRRDGLAVEIVHYGDYECTNKNFFLKPSRRNGQCIANGTVEKPVYKWRLRRTYRKVRFIWKLNKWGTIRNIILGFRFRQYPDAFALIPKRFPGCPMDEIIGKLPADEKDFYEVNILFLRKKRVCSVVHYTDYCGEHFQNIKPTPLLPELSEFEYRFPEDTIRYDFTVNFKQGKASYNYADIKPLLDTIRLENYNIVKLHINASASVEGSEEVNKALTLKRTMSIRKVLDSMRVDTLIHDIDTREDWEHFYARVGETKYAYLKNMDHARVKKELENHEISKDLEDIFSQERKAEVKLWLMLRSTDSARIHNALLQYRQFSGEADKKKITAKDLQKLYNIQTYLYKSVVAKKVAATDLYTVKFPDSKPYARIHRNEVIFNHLFDSTANRDITKLYHSFKEDAMSKQATQVQRYNFLSILINQWDSLHYYDHDEKITPEKVFGLLGRLGGKAIPKDTLDQLKMNFYFKAADWFYKTKPDAAFQAKAMNNLFYVYKTRHYNDSVAYKMARYFIYYYKDEYAYRILAPFALAPKPNHEVFILYLKMAYLQDMYKKNGRFYKLMKKAPGILSQDEYCHLFTGPCNISFQVLDNETIRTQWCQTCTGYPNYATWYREQQLKKK
ncbi:MAG: hypothetical protein JST26_03545 [Bacteroidetes bacterium]|nr:hypothetical protein [Bacteroidota bacterium]